VAVLAHIWPSNQASETTYLARHLGLPENFHVTERNFLKLVEQAFDADALSYRYLVIPSRGPPPEARFRQGTIERMTPITHADVRGYAGRQLYLPNAASGKVPYMHLLGWKAVSALRARAEEAAARADLPADLELHSSMDAEGVAAVRNLVDSLRSAGWRLLLRAEACA
jgi:hypothetical protein